ncbi:MAG: hypothetical protein INR65_10185 [Gluconacetobacter diazotrophicus]|nr:hypothetical protein [Gluconacetobacter diazotrophicus]
MASITLTRAYDTHEDARRAVAALEESGIPHADISLVGRNGTVDPADADLPREGLPEEDRLADAEAGAGTGASIGTILGGGAGLLAGIGSLAIPGVGPVVAAGWLVATLAGAGVGAAIGGGAGGLVGALVGAGVDEEDAHVYAETVRRGGNVVSTRIDEVQVPAAEAVLDRFGPIDTGARRADLRSAGWERHDADGQPWSAAPVPGSIPPAPPTIDAGTGSAPTATPGTGLTPAGIPTGHPAGAHGTEAELPAAATGAAGPTSPVEAAPTPGAHPASPAAQPALGAGARAITGDDPAAIGGASSGLPPRINPLP